eukprot:6192061-Pleurochrysis_carterae.AAC.4
MQAGIIGPTFRRSSEVVVLQGQASFACEWHIGRKSNQGTGIRTKSVEAFSCWYGAGKLMRFSRWTVVRGYRRCAAFMNEEIKTAEEQRGFLKMTAGEQTLAAPPISPTGPVAAALHKRVMYPWSTAYALAAF